MTNSLNKAESPNNFQIAVETYQQDAIIVANAGSGKTTLLVEHYFFLLNKGFEPNQILTFTFTEKAANEIKDRIIKQVETHKIYKGLSKDQLQSIKEKIQGSNIGTMHQFCLKIIQETHRSKGSRDFKVIDETTEIQLRERVLKEHVRSSLEKENENALFLLKEFGIARLQRLIREYLNLREICQQATTPLKLPPLESDETQIQKSLELFCRPIINKIESVKNSKYWVSFDDLEEKAIHCVRDPNPNLVKFLSQLEHVLVDEFQDTSPHQINLINALRNQAQTSKKPLRLFCVGDPKQSIYRFRNVDQNLINNTQESILKDKGKRFDLSINYRSSVEVVEIVNAFSSNAFPKESPSQPAHGKVNIRPLIANFIFQKETYSLDKAREWEANWVSRKILDLQKQDAPLEEIAVLFRASASALPFIETFKKVGIPYTIRGGQELFHQQEIYDLKNFLYFLANPNDRIALIGLLRSPYCLISDAALYFLLETKPSLDLWEYLKNGDFPDKLKSNCPEDTQKLLWFISSLKKLMYISSETTPHQLIMDIVSHFDMERILFRINEDMNSILAVEQFIHWTKTVSEEDPQMGIKEFVSYLKQIEKVSVPKTPLGDLIGKKGCVQLLTIHASKGLEFDTVFIVDTSRRPRLTSPLIQSYQGQLAFKVPITRTELSESPRYKNLKAFHQEEEHEEAKRLLYVAMTRAKKRLLITINPKGAVKGSLQAILEDSLPEGNPWKSQIPENQYKEPPKKQSNGSPIRVRPATVTRPTLHQVHTVSELETFATCQLKHYFRYPQELSDQKWEYPPVPPAAEIGTLLHKTLHLLYLNPQLNPNKALAEMISRENIHLSVELQKLIELHFQNYLSSKLFDKIQTAKEDLSELPFLLSFSEGNIKGQIDRLISTEDRWTLIDFKWSSRPVGQKEMESSYTFQLKTYALAAQRILKGIVPAVEIHHLNEAQSYGFTFYENDLRTHEEKLSRHLKNLKNPILENTVFKQACHRCAFNHISPVCPIPKGHPFTLFG